MIDLSWASLRRNYLMTPVLLRSIPVGVVIAAGVLATAWTHRLLSDHQDLVVHTYEAIDTTKDVLIGLDDAETGQRGYLLSGDRRYLDPYDKALGRLARLRVDLAAKISDNSEILAGAITRGSGTTVSAAILVCDLRDFTTISELWPRDDVIDVLNGYFDAMCDPIEAHGGEILKFMGDGLLAIFPPDQPTACNKLLQAVAEAQRNVAVFNEELQRTGRPLLRYGIGIHVGDVMYGNIGSKRRLDFTVIGPAVNTASRLEALTKDLKRPVLLSKAFASLAGCRTVLESLGSFPLRGVNESIEVFAFAGDMCTAPLYPAPVQTPSA